MDGEGRYAVNGEAWPELIARARHDPAAFGELYDLYLPRVYAFCRRYSRTREEAQDLTAQTFERALAAITHYEDRNVPFSRWLLRIAHNVVLNQARHSGQETTLGDSSSSPDDGDPLQDWEQAHWLATHVQRLPDDQREAVRLRFYEDQRFQDVAAKMGRSEGAVKQLLRRALRTLHRQIEGENHEGAVNE